MDLMLLAVSVFTVVFTLFIGFIIIQKLFPYSHIEIDISKAFKSEQYQKVITLISKYPQAKQLSLDIYSYVARSYSFLGEHEESIKWWERALSKHDLLTNNRIFVELEIGDELFILKKYNKAELHYRTAYSMDNNHERATHKLAQVLFMQGQADKSRKLLRPMLKANPSLIESRKLYAESLASLKMHNKAIRHYSFLANIKEPICSPLYAETLKSLKMWEEAYQVYRQLIDNSVPTERENLISDFIQVCIGMKKYHESLGLIEEYLANVKNPQVLIDLKYLRANIFHLKGDQMLALKEFQQLYQSNPFYKDIKSFVEQNEYRLNYPFLFNYFTSNESVFENLIIRLMPAGSKILRRSTQFFLCLSDTTVYIFYRELRPVAKTLLDNMEVLAYQNCPGFEKLELWTMDGTSINHTITGQKYRFIIREGEDFLVQLNIAVSQMDHVEEGSPLNFVGGLRNVSEVVPILQESVDQKVETIINNKITDEFIEKAFD